MKHIITTLALAPILIPQGLFVRRVTPRLPEPAGERTGIAGSGPEIRLLIIGDSAAAGVGADTQREALAGQLVAALATSHQVCWTLTAQTGRTLQDVNDALQEIPDGQFDAVLISIGVNDVTGGTSQRRWIAGLHRLADQLRTRFQSRYLLFTSVPPMHEFPALPQPLRWYLGQRAKQLNTWMAQMTSQQSASQFLAIPFPLEPAYMATDGFHPGPAAYKIWGQHAANTIRQLVSEVRLTSRSIS